MPWSCSWTWSFAASIGTIEWKCKAFHAQKCYLDSFKFLSRQASATVWSGLFWHCNSCLILIYKIIVGFLLLCCISTHWFFFLKQVKPALPALARLIYSNDEEVLTDACWALSYLSDGTNDKIQAVIEAGVCPRLVEFLMWVQVKLYRVPWLFNELFVVCCASVFLCAFFQASFSLCAYTCSSNCW